jgi:hypothetical protein
MRRYGLLLGAALILAGSAQAGMEIKYACSDKVIYDTDTQLWWYPCLTHMIGMNKSQQLAYIAQLGSRRYAKAGDWQMADYDQLCDLKDSLASMGCYRVEHTFPWTPPDAPRNVGSPFLAWSVQVDKYFTPTTVMTQPLPGVPGLILGGHPMQVFNGRFVGPSWRTNAPGTPPTWECGEADDHFVTSAFKTPGQYATMTFNYDTHYLADSATDRPGFPGPVGAWAVSKKGPTFGARMTVKPSMLVRSYLNTGQYDTISCQITGLENHTVNFIDACTIRLAGCAAPVSYRFLGGLCLTVEFKTCDVLHLLHAGSNELVVCGKLTNGFRFEAKGSIWVW